jgi:hydrogenase maturation protein HypF
LNQAVARGLNAPLTSSAGRLFDAVASLVGLRDRVAFEAQGAMELEALARGDADRTYPVGLGDAGGKLVVRTGDVIRGVVEDLLAGEEPASIATRFHATLADLIAAMCVRIREKTRLNRVALSGGVFQNVRLVETAVARLEGAGFEALTHRQVPPNDGGLALGQAAVAACLTVARTGA